MKRNNNQATSVLKSGGLVVMATDTIYGIMACVSCRDGVKRLSNLRSGDGRVGFIVLAPDVETVLNMSQVTKEQVDYLRDLWPRKVSVVLPANDEWSWLAADDGTIAFRVPDDANLRNLLCETGAVVAPSANPPGEKPARNIAEARAYFGAAVDLYVDDGERQFNTPSKLIRLNCDGTVEILRPSADDFVITRRRKKYKFARFDEFSNCFHFDQWIKVRDQKLRADAKLVVEIGAGSALFSTELARQNLSEQFIAVDIKGDRLYQGARVAIEQNIDNITFVRADIARIGEVVPPSSVDEIWLTFPDPWTGKSDARHRLTAPRFLGYYREILRPGGVINFKTDNDTLFDWSLEQFEKNGWRTEFVTRDLHDSDAPDEAKIMTTYESRFAREGLKINYVMLTEVPSKIAR